MKKSLVTTFSLQNLSFVSFFRYNYTDIKVQNFTQKELGERSVFRVFFNKNEDIFIEKLKS